MDENPNPNQNDNTIHNPDYSKKPHNPLSDEEFNNLLHEMKEYSEEPRYMVAKAKSKEKVHRIIEKIKFLLESEEQTYTIKMKSYNLFPTTLAIDVVTNAMETTIKNHPIFREIINEVDSYSVSALLNEKIEISFTISDYYIET